MNALPMLYYAAWQPWQVEIAAVGGADRRSAKNEARPMRQSRKAHHSAWPLHSPVGGPVGRGVCADWAPEGHDQQEQPFPDREGYASRVRRCLSPGHGRPEREQPGYGAC
jgi:hypothetical protein